MATGTIQICFTLLDSRGDGPITARDHPSRRPQAFHICGGEYGVPLPDDKHQATTKVPSPDGTVGLSGKWVNRLNPEVIISFIGHSV
jgi:hypothetical protein